MGSSAAVAELLLGHGHEISRRLRLLFGNLIRETRQAAVFFLVRIYTAIKLPRCQGEGGAESGVGWAQNMSVDETVTPSTRELNTTPDDPGFMT